MAAKREQEERPEWELTNCALMLYTSLMIILLTFFIFLSSKSVVDENREMKAMGSLVNAFGILPGGLSPVGEEKTGSIAPPTSPIQVIQNDMDLIREVLENQILAGKVNFLRGRTRRIISLNAAVLFPQDGVEILPEMKPILLQIAQILKGSKYPIIIEAHTDDQPPQTENLKDNWQVSTQRAVAVLRFFIEEGGLEPHRLSAYGYAGNKPLAANNSPENRQRNNRIDLILDQTLEAMIYRHEQRQKQGRIFDFKGFYFRLFGEEKAGGS